MKTIFIYLYFYLVYTLFYNTFFLFCLFKKSFRLHIYFFIEKHYKKNRPAASRNLLCVLYLCMEHTTKTTNTVIQHGNK